MKTKTLLFADSGKVLTDGKSYGKTVMLADDRKSEDFYEITEKEYEKILKETAQEEIQDENIS